MVMIESIVRLDRFRTRYTREMSGKAISGALMRGQQRVVTWLSRPWCYLTAAIFLALALTVQTSKAAGPPPTIENIAYGPHERNKLDLWQAPSNSPTPLLIFIHGGGFVMGDKSSCRSMPAIAQCLDAGVSFAAINYRFRNQCRCKKSSGMRHVPCNTSAVVPKNLTSTLIESLRTAVQPGGHEHLAGLSRRSSRSKRDRSGAARIVAALRRRFPRRAGFVRLA